MRKSKVELRSSKAGLFSRTMIFFAGFSWEMLASQGTKQETPVSCCFTPHHNRRWACNPLSDSESCLRVWHWHRRTRVAAEFRVIVCLCVLLGAKGIATRSKDATRGSWPFLLVTRTLLGVWVQPELHGVPMSSTPFDQQETERPESWTGQTRRPDRAEKHGTDILTCSTGVVEKGSMYTIFHTWMEDRNHRSTTLPLKQSHNSRL